MFAGPRFWTAGPMAAEEQTRRLINLIFAGRNRMVMIRRELPRTRRAGWVLEPFRIEASGGFSFSWSLRCHRLCRPNFVRYAAAATDARWRCSALTAIAQMNP